ncbi:hypothetical protein JKP88DRAFT_268874, partial [Tribonema minus]
MPHKSCCRPLWALLPGNSSSAHRAALSCLEPHICARRAHTIVCARGVNPPPAQCALEVQHQHRCRRRLLPPRTAWGCHELRTTRYGGGWLIDALAWWCGNCHRSGSKVTIMTYTWDQYCEELGPLQSRRKQRLASIRHLMERNVSITSVHSDFAGAYQNTVRLAWCKHSTQGRLPCVAPSGVKVRRELENAQDTQVDSIDGAHVAEVLLSIVRYRKLLLLASSKPELDFINVQNFTR